MTSRAYLPLCQVIESVRVLSTPKPIVFVITENPSMTESAKDFCRRANANVSIIWLTSVASACQRLEWDRAAMVFLDQHFLESEATSEALIALRSASPGTRVVLLADDPVRS